MSDWIADKKDDNHMVESSIAEMVVQTANQFIYERMLPAGFEYHKECGAYYNQQSGYYYDPNSNLFFHPFTNAYYRYNEESNEYDTFKLGLKEMKIPVWTKNGFKKRAENICGIQFVQNASQEDIEIMELTLDLVDRCSFLAGDYSTRLKKRVLIESRLFEEEIDGIIIKRANINQMDMLDQNISISSDEDDENLNLFLRSEHERRMAEEKMANEAPCIRLILQPANKLHIVTILGAQVGFSSKMDIQLENVTELEENDQVNPIFIIRYINEGNYENPANCLERRSRGRYQFEMPSCIKVPVYLNGKQLMPEGCHQITHGDVFQIGNSQSGFNSMKCHIHSGLNTCPGCEPGLFINKCSENSHQIKLRKFSKNAERRKQTRALKEQYGLLEKNDSMQDIRSNYVDKTKKRKTVGSIGPNEIKNQAGGIYSGCLAAPISGCAVDSVQLMASSSNSSKISKGIEEENKGYRLLKGMGWKEGQGLGRSKQGIQEPIITTIKNDRAGFGVEKEQKMSKISIRMKDERRQQILEKTKKRYEQILKKQNE